MELELAIFQLKFDEVPQSLACKEGEEEKRGVNGGGEGNKME